ncbi:hypothetical protein AVEN_19994-1, partial [Araneus ventricosus]
MPVIDLCPEPVRITASLVYSPKLPMPVLPLGVPRGSPRDATAKGRLSIKRNCQLFVGLLPTPTNIGL